MEFRDLADQGAKPRMGDVEGEGEPAPAELGMRDRQRAGCEDAGQGNAQAAEAQEIAHASEHERVVLDADAERHADPAADMLLQAGGPGEELRRMDDLRPRLATRIEPRPVLPAAARVFRHGDDACGTFAHVARERLTDQLGEEGQDAAREARADLGDAALVDGHLARRHALGEARAHGLRQFGPLRVGEKRAEPQIAERFACLGRSFQNSQRIARRSHDILPAFYLTRFIGRRLTMRAPSLISAASFPLGMPCIWSYQPETSLVKASIAFRRSRATALTRGSCAASVTQASSALTAGSISRSLRPEAMRRAISHTSVSASNWSRRSPITGTRRIRLQDSSSLIELETLERAMPSASEISSAVSGFSER